MTCGAITPWTGPRSKQGWELTMTPRESEIVMDMLYTCEDPPEIEVETLDYLGHRDWGGQADGGIGRDGLRILRGSRSSRGATRPREPGRRPGIPKDDGAERTGRRRGRSGLRAVISKPQSLRIGDMRDDCEIKHPASTRRPQHRSRATENQQTT